MKKTAMLKAIEAKVTEIDVSLDTLLKSDASENTKRTQKFQKTSVMRSLTVLKEILKLVEGADVRLSEPIEKWFTSMVTLTAERKAAVTVEVKEGDNIMQFMEEHRDIKDIYKKMMVAAEKAGLKADFAKGVFVKE